MGEGVSGGNCRGDRRVPVAPGFRGRRCIPPLPRSPALPLALRRANDSLARDLAVSALEPDALDQCGRTVDIDDIQAPNWRRGPNHQICSDARAPIPSYAISGPCWIIGDPNPRFRAGATLS